MSGSTELQHHLRMLHRLGLYAIPGWGGGKLMRGAKPGELALSPPSLSETLAADYSDGLIILGGTENPFGGYLACVDVDSGPESWPYFPLGFLYAELGTKTTKRHFFVRTTDRLEGQVLLRSRSDLVAEIKGLNLSLRSWPSRPVDKPRGYLPSAWATDPISDPPVLTAGQLGEGLADFLSNSLGTAVYVEDARHRKSHRPRIAVSSNLVDEIEAELERRNVRLRRPGAAGWQTGFCPFHDNTRTPAFSVHFEFGWICRSTCGKGGIRNLAHRLGISFTSGPAVIDPHKPVKVTNWEVRV